MNDVSPGVGDRLIAKQLSRSALVEGGIDLAKFTALVAARYDEAEREQRRMTRAMSLMADELAAANLGLQRQNQRFAAALENMSLGLAMYDAEERLVVANARLCEVLSLPPDAIRVGMTLSEVIAVCAAAAKFGDALPEDIYQDQRRHFLPGSACSFEERRGDHVVGVTTRAMLDGGCVLTFDDRTERRQAEERVEYMARHDALTGLPNRTQLRTRIDQALNDTGGRFAVLCLDLDRFKEVNDTLGHHAGDELLRALTLRLRSIVRDADTVVRLGGDEFAIVQASVLRRSDVTALAARLIEEISQPYVIDGQQVSVGASIGIAFAPADGDTAEELLKRADMAMYASKANGRGTWSMFEPEMDQRMQERRQLETDLRQGLERDEFEVLFQPLINVTSQHITSFEALLRWNHPVRGLVSPADFIPLAEETGLIVPIGAWVLARACQVATTWPDDISIAVNVSAVQFRAPGLVDAVKEALARSGLPGARLEIEITESIVLQDNTTTLAILHRLRGLGVRIAMDDFGTGYSSLSYLRSFPFDKIKIDQSFVRALGNSDDARAIVRAISGLGSSLGMRTTAEGVETREQFEELQADGCTEAQGYFFGKPMSPLAATALLAAGLPRACLAAGRDADA